MSLVVVVLLLALVAGRLCGGRLSRLGDLRLRSLALVPAALGLQLAGGLLGGVAYPVGLASSALLVLVFLGQNRGLRGTSLLALGLLANALVVGLNGAMPVSATAAARAGVPLVEVVGDPRHELATSDTRLPLLADVVPVPLPPRAE
ncbi:MAG TPA: DUF5317 family protein, partial [Mycobacteriales bacterium]|nr:DUF5317 family protein [Mycobacteriales bacterium]